MMTAKKAILLALLLCAAATVKAQDIDPPMPGMLELESHPRGAEIFLGDSLLGSTPMRVRRSDAERLRVYYPARNAWNAQVRTLPSAMPGAGEGIVLPRFDRSILLRSLPHGARVFRGDTLLGVTPLRVDAASGSLRVDALGYEGVDWDPASTTRSEYLLLLQPLGDGMRAGSVEYRGSGLRLPPVDVLLPAGAGLLAGVAAVIFKQKADAQYADYLATGEEELLSQTKKYDIYAGISLALLQLGLAYFIYRLFDE
ncbi:MAG: hypothetical protein RRA94_09195 [Bacteroidota bacterium]|nr:hypothetical protein [Bacteroidota bacterium]